MSEESFQQNIITEMVYKIRNLWAVIVKLVKKWLIN